MSERRVCTCVYDLRKDFVSVCCLGFLFFFFFLALLRTSPTTNTFLGAPARGTETHGRQSVSFCEGASAHLGGESV